MESELCERVNYDALCFYLNNYIKGYYTLPVFMKWFIPKCWNTSQADQFVWEVKLLVSEYTNGHKTEHELKEELTKINRKIHESV